MWMSPVLELPQPFRSTQGLDAEDLAGIGHRQLFLLEGDTKIKSLSFSSPLNFEFCFLFNSLVISKSPFIPQLRDSKE